jgi:hypothetical protein
MHAGGGLTARLVQWRRVAGASCILLEDQGFQYPHIYIYIYIYILLLLLLSKKSLAFLWISSSPRKALEWKAPPT